MWFHDLWIKFTFISGVDGEISAAGPEGVTLDMDSPEEDEQKNLYLFSVRISMSSCSERHTLLIDMKCKDLF